MKLTNRLIKTSILMMFSLYSCSPESVPSQNNIQKNNLSNKYTVKGTVQFDSFKVKNETEITRKATISIIYPPDYSDLALRNTTLATGITNEQGNFTINPNQGFVPETNKVMILEATKRVNGVGNSITSLRTHIRWNGQKWDSISTPENYINTRTTALALISALDPNILSYANSINRLNVQNGVSTVTYDSKLTEGILNMMLEKVANTIIEFKDPAQEIYAISFDGRPYINSTVNKIKDNMNTYRTMVETYAVDWGGLYPATAEGLDQETKDKNYFKNFKNPFADLEPISKTLPVAINYNDYEQAKNTLNYKGIQLQNKGNLKGIVVYKPTEPTNNNYFTSYYIYAVDVFGDLLKTNNQVTSQIFYLTNY